jgi:hypothetical protein
MDAFGRRCRSLPERLAAAWRARYGPQHNIDPAVAGHPYRIAGSQVGTSFEPAAVAQSISTVKSQVTIGLPPEGAHARAGDCQFLCVNGLVGGGCRYLVASLSP